MAKIRDFIRAKAANLSKAEKVKLTPAIMNPEQWDDPEGISVKALMRHGVGILRAFRMINAQLQAGEVQVDDNIRALIVALPKEHEMIVKTTALAMKAHEKQLMQLSDRLEKMEEIIYKLVVDDGTETNKEAS